jgi:hypothetical protein
MPKRYPTVVARDVWYHIIPVFLIFQTEAMSHALDSGSAYSVLPIKLSRNLQHAFTVECSDSYIFVKSCICSPL